MKSVLLDTHIWIWLSIGDLHSLSAQAQRSLKGVPRWISAISCWELAKLVERRRIGFTIPTLSWIRRSLTENDIRIADLHAFHEPYLGRRALPLGGCFSETYQKGYVVPEGALEQIPIGASQEQVLILMGTPSTVATVSGEVFYYISQRAERQVAFMQQAVVDQRVVAVYFDRSRRVERLANYGMRDGRIFDYVSRTTPSGGEEINYVGGIFKALSF